MNKNTVLIRNAQPFDFGGAERFPVFLASELSVHGLEPIIISRSTALTEFANIHKQKTIKGWWWSQQNWNGLRALLSPIYIAWQVILYFYYLLLFIRIRPLNVHIQSKDDFIAATFAAKTLKKGVIWTDHADLKHILKNLNIWYRNPVGKLVYIAAQFTDYISVVSESEKRLVASRLNRRSKIIKKIHVIYNGAFDHYTPTKKNIKFTFISTARLVGDKGIYELITAFKKLQIEYPSIQLQLIGDGPERKHFESLAKNIDNIRFLGHQADPLTYLASAHIFVLPTYHEGFSLALVEACMEKLAIITTSVGGNPEIITHEKNGLLISKKSVDELYNAMKQLYENETLRKTLAANARKAYLADFNFKKIVEKDFLPLYRNGF